MKSEQINSSPNSTLDLAVNEFALWRSTRVSRRASTPQYLRVRAISLLSNYRRGHVTKALGINSTSLHAWQASLNTIHEDNTFIPVNIENDTSGAVAHSVSTVVEFTLSYTPGAVMTIKGSLSGPQITAICQGLRVSHESSAVYP